MDVGWQRSYVALFIAAVALALIATHPRVALVVLSYSYVVAALIGWGLSRWRKKPVDVAPPSDVVEPLPEERPSG